MISLRTLVRVAAKSLGWLFVALVATALLWFAGNRLLDESPDLKLRAFAVSPADQIPDDRNTVVGFLGLAAPKGSDVMEYGAKVKALYARGAPRAQIEAMTNRMNLLLPTVTSDQVYCWIDAGGFEWKGCLPFDQAPTVLGQNKELLDRYKALYHLDGYSNLDGYNYYTPAYYIVLKLSMAEMHVDIQQGNFETAYRKWRDQFLFVKKNLRGTDTWVGKAIGLVAHGFTLPILEKLILANPAIARQHTQELLDILKPEGMSAFNTDGIVRGEYSLFAKSLRIPPQEIPGFETDRLQWLAFHFGQPNRALNRYAAFTQEYASRLRLPLSEMEAESARLEDKYAHPSNWDLIIDPFGSLYVYYNARSQLRATEMVRQMHIIDGRLRLATIVVHLVNEDVQDKDISGFLASTDPDLRDPFSDAPMRWDPKDRKIYFPDPVDKCAIGSYFLVPGHKKNGMRSETSITNTKAC